MLHLSSDFDPLSSAEPLIVYFDIKSPYAFAAKDPTYALADELCCDIDWRPVTLDIPSYLGSARLDKTGTVAKSNRTPEQWGSVRYAYMDARRYASAWGYGLRGTEKIWDTSLVHIAFSWVKHRAPETVRRFLDLAYPRFWLRDLDVENLDVVTHLIESCGVSSKGFADWAARDGRVEHDQQQVAIFSKGIYGVPGYICERAYYFGREHLPHLGQIIAGKPAGSLDVGYSLPAPAQIEVLDDGKHRVFLELLAAARSNSLEIIAGVNSDCVQTHLALKTLEEIQRAFPQRLSIRYGQVAGQALANSSASEVAEPDYDVVGTIENRGDAHRSFRSRYELMDARRYEKWREVDNAELNSKRFAEITIDPEATRQLEAGGISRSFGFLFVEQNQQAHIFRGRTHLPLLRWALENA